SLRRTSLLTPTPSTSIRDTTSSGNWLTEKAYRLSTYSALLSTRISQPKRYRESSSSFSEFMLILPLEMLNVCHGD
ncbi:MAG: hypothetical protein ABJQ38_16765, partial [Flavobacteriaceae bacterium]